VAKGGAEIVGREIFSGEEEGQIFGQFIGSGGAGFPAGVEVAEMRMVGSPRSEALTAVGKGETTQGHTVL